MNAPREGDSLTLGELHAVLAYDSETGLFTWRVQRGRQKAGQLAGGPHPKGYRTLRLGKREYLHHRLAWFYVHGEWPRHQIDHRDGDRANNALANLRPATAFENNRNRAPHPTRNGGLKGVSYHKPSGLWRARIRTNDVQTCLGYFRTPEEAHAAYVEAAPMQHGQFARSAP